MRRRLLRVETHLPSLPPIIAARHHLATSYQRYQSYGMARRG